MKAIRPVPYDQASGRLRALYDDICTTREISSPPNWATYLGANPGVLEGIWQMGRSVAAYRLSPLLIQLVLFAVSRANSAEYCAEYHGHLILQLNNNLGYGDLLAICNGDSRGVIPDSFQTAIAVSSAQAMRRCCMPDEDLLRLREAGFEDAAILELFGTIAFANLLNAYTMAASVPIDEPCRIPGFKI